MTVYLVTNLINGHQYVGITTKSLTRRWACHKAAASLGSRQALHRALRKYGPENFKIVQIASALNVESLKEIERKMIVLHKTRSPYGYNMTNGGDGTAGLTHTDDSKRKIGAFWKGKSKSSEEKLKISAAHKGKTLSPEHRAKLSKSKTGLKLPPFTDDHKRRISESNTGRKHSKETLLKMSLAKKGKPWTIARRLAA